MSINSFEKNKNRRYEQHGSDDANIFSHLSFTVTDNGVFNDFVITFIINIVYNFFQNKILN